jgi:hypothetical protein
MAAVRHGGCFPRELEEALTSSTIKLPATRRSAFSDTRISSRVAYRKTVLDGCRPFLAPHFNLTVELPLKAIVRGYSWTVIPITWRNRHFGTPKLGIKEMGSRYLFICLYVWLEKFFSRR